MVLLGLARCRTELHQPEAARPILDGLLATHPGDGLILLERGKVALQSSELAEAESYLRKAVAASPHNQTANYLLGQCLNQRGRPEEALQYMQEADRIHSELERLRDLMRQTRDAPPDPNTRYEIGRLLLQNAHEQEGLVWLEGLLETAPQHVPTHELLSDYYERKGDVSRAARHRQLAQNGKK
jgi:predicted Zn-dependent protease